MSPEDRRRMLAGIGGLTLPIPRFLSGRGLARGVEGAAAKAARLSQEERRIHHHIVRLMPTVQRPIEALQISEELHLPLDMVRETIDKLEGMKTFLFRSEGQGIDWAYPVSLDETGHEMRCSTGERFNAAWAIDAFATPFVQGRLQDRYLEYTIRSACSNTGRVLEIGIDSDLSVGKVTAGASPMFSMALVDTDKMREKSIVDVF